MQIGRSRAVDPKFHAGGVFGIAIDVEFDVIVHPERFVGHILKIPVVDHRRGNLNQRLDGIVGSQVVGDDAPGRKPAQAVDVGVKRLRIGVVNYADNTALGVIALLEFLLDQHGIPGILDDQPPNHGSVLEDEHIRRVK